MCSTEQVFKQFYVKLVKSLPMQNAIFLAELFSAHMLSLDLKRRIKAEKTPEDKAMCFLDDKIYHDISKGDFRSFDALLDIMKQKEFRVLNNLAEKIKTALVVEAAVNPSNIEGYATEAAVTSAGRSRLTVASLDSKPEFSDLELKFEKVADWESVCPYLLKDDDGQKTYQIRRSNIDLEGRRDKMLKEFLKQPNPTWRDVVQALRIARYNNLADEIEHGLQVPTGTVKALPDVLTTSESLDSRPKFPELKRKFEGIADWEAVCPYLLNDDDGQKTKKIKIDNADVDSRRAKMLQEFLEQPNPTWRDVVLALRAGRYNNSADQIEHELRG